MLYAPTEFKKMTPKIRFAIVGAALAGITAVSWLGCLLSDQWNGGCAGTLFVLSVVGTLALLVEETKTCPCRWCEHAQCKADRSKR